MPFLGKRGFLVSDTQHHIFCQKILSNFYSHVEFDTTIFDVLRYNSKMIRFIENRIHMFDLERPDAHVTMNANKRLIITISLLVNLAQICLNETSNT